MSRFSVALFVVVALLGSSIGSTTHAASAPPERGTRHRLIELVNAERALAGLPPLTVHPLLMSEAQRFSAVQADLGTVSHRGSDGTDAGQRLSGAGYEWRFFGETLAAGQPTAERVVRAWMNSPSHRAVILTPKATQLGMGHTIRGNDPSRYVNYYVMEVGRPR